MRSTIAGIAVAVLSTASTVSAGEDFATHEYVSNCAGCHGISGRGGEIEVPLSLNDDYSWATNQSLSTTEIVLAPDLTRIAKDNGGAFPDDRVYSHVDGRWEGGTTHAMPHFGAQYFTDAGRDYLDVVPFEPERYVETHIVALVGHVRELEAK